MKRFIFAVSLFLPVSASAAFIESYNQMDSTYTAQSVTTRLVPNTRPGTNLYGVVVGSISAGGQLIIYDSSGTATNQVASIALSSLAYYNFEIMLSSGLTYTTTSNTGGLTITFKRR